MQSSASKAYLENKILTASPEQLQSMLYDAAVRFALQCRAAVAESDFERAQIAYENCDAVLCELHLGLRPEVSPEIAENFASLYSFCQLRLDQGNLRHDTKPIDEAISILRHLRQTWSLLMDQLAKEDAGPASPSATHAIALAVET